MISRCLCGVSRNHPQSNGLAERMVQMVKRALRKYCLLYDRLHWDEFLPWIAMGYRMSSHVALGGYSPYFLLFGRHFIVGSHVRDIVAEPIDLDDPLQCAAIMRERALLFQKVMPMAFDNLAIAQHRDTLRYAHTRSGEFLPKLKRFEEGDLVYLRRQPADSMDPKSGRIILRVKKVLGTGRLLLEGRDTKTIKEHVENCAPCHNPNIDLFQNPALTDQEIDQACEVCQDTTVNRRTGAMLLCDNCNTGWHIHEVLDTATAQITSGRLDLLPMSGTWPGRSLSPTLNHRLIIFAPSGRLRLVGGEDHG
jgi:hypothetical protein